MKQYSKAAAVALGLFDGIHLGHRAVLSAALRQKKCGLLPCAFTFHAEMAKQKQAQWLYSTDQKVWMLEHDCGMERILAPPFEMVCEMTGEAFVRQVLCERLQAAHICCGYDFRFGRGAHCGVRELEQFGKTYGFTVELVEQVQVDGVTVSSTGIRSLLQNGGLERANRLLGKPYLIRQEVTYGAQLGRTIGFPTINQLFAEGQLVPEFGVYVSRTRIPEGVWLPSLTNIGRKPTVQYDGQPLAETYIDGYSGNLYGQTLHVALHQFLRPEQKFPSVEALTEQMQKDLHACRELSRSFHHSDT